MWPFDPVEAPEQDQHCVPSEGWDSWAECHIQVILNGSSTAPRISSIGLMFIPDPLPNVVFDICLYDGNVNVGSRIGPCLATDSFLFSTRLSFRSVHTSVE